MIEDSSIEAGACQNQNEVFLNEELFHALPLDLILHELVQGIRLKKNLTRENSKRISRNDVRAIKVAIDYFIDSTPSDSEAINKLVAKLKDFNFGTYQTFTQLANAKMAAVKKQQEREILFQSYNKLKKESHDLLIRNCSGAIRKFDSADEYAAYHKGSALAISKTDDFLNEISKLKFKQSELIDPNDIRHLEFEYSDALYSKQRCFNHLNKMADANRGL